MVQEQPAAWLAGMDPAEICVNMQRICSYARIMPKYVYYMLLYAIIM